MYSSSRGQFRTQPSAVCASDALAVAVSAGLGRGAVVRSDGRVAHTCPVRSSCGLARARRAAGGVRVPRSAGVLGSMDADNLVGCVTLAARPPARTRPPIGNYYSAARGQPGGKSVHGAPPESRGGRDPGSAPDVGLKHRHRRRAGAVRHQWLGRPTTSAHSICLGPMRKLVSVDVMTLVCRCP